MPQDTCDTLQALKRNRASSRSARPATGADRSASRAPPSAGHRPRTPRVTAHPVTRDTISRLQPSSPMHRNSSAAGLRFGISCHHLIQSKTFCHNRRWARHPVQPTVTSHHDADFACLIWRTRRQTANARRYYPAHTHPERGLHGKLLPALIVVRKVESETFIILAQA